MNIFNFDPHRPNIFCEYECASWEELRSIGLALEHWIFRGQSNAEWGLQTTLERLVSDHSYSIRKIKELEDDIVRQFQRRARHHTTALPNQDNLFEWISIIQHHGGPTRLLDFTHSFYVACHFSINTTKNRSAIYCLNKSLVQHFLESDARISPEDSSYAVNSTEYCEEALRIGARGPMVLISEPFASNERMAAQQGLFVFPMVVENGFEYNLSLTVSRGQKELPPTVKLHDFNKDLLFSECALFKIVISGELQHQIKIDLMRMNINDATLFPGIDGFARSLSDLAYKNDNG